MNLPVRIVKGTVRRTKKIIRRFVNLFRSEQDISTNYWKSQKEWRVKDALKERYTNTKKFIDEKYIPLLKSDDIVCDYGCACGEWSFAISPYVKSIDAYDMNRDLISQGIKDAEELGITNVNFETSEASTFSFQKQYDSIMILGLFTCIFDDKVCLNLVKDASDAIKKSGYLIVKDTITLGNDDMKYVEGNYAGMYRNREKYIGFYQNNGFKLIEETYLMEKKNFNGTHVASFMGIFEKMK